MSFTMKDSPRALGRPVRGGQASQWRSGCELQMTMSLSSGRMSCGLSTEMCNVLPGVGVGVVELVDEGKTVEE